MFVPTFFLVVAGLSFAQTKLSNFYDWLHQRVALENTAIHFRYAGSGPPILLIHGVPEHSPTWEHIGPILAQKYTVIAVDDRGAGDSSLATDDDYSAEAAAGDMKGVLDFLNITQVYVVGHDKGAGIAAALAANNRNLVKRISLTEYPLPGFGAYEGAQTPAPDWTAYSNWQLAFFTVPDVAQYFLQGKERDYLTWYFYHASYSGNAVLSNDKLELYARAVQKPGFLRAAFKYFEAQWADADFFKATVGPNPLAMPALIMGGEASFAPISLLQQAFEHVTSNATFDIIPKAGHWMGEENPTWFANRVMQFLDEDEGIPAVDLSVLDNQVTLPQQVAMGAFPSRRMKRRPAASRQHAFEMELPEKF